MFRFATFQRSVRLFNLGLLNSGTFTPVPHTIYGQVSGSIALQTVFSLRQVGVVCMFWLVYKCGDVIFRLARLG